MKNVSYENKLVLSFIDFVLFIMKWISLSICVVISSLTIGLIVMNLIENSSIPSNFFISMVSAITSYSFADASELVGLIGKTKALIGTVGLGMAFSVNYALLYMITTDFRVVFKSFANGNIYTKDNVLIVERIIPKTLLLAFLLPIIKFFLVISVGMLDFADVNASGLLFVFIAVVIKMLLENGYNLSKELDKKDLELSDLKAFKTEEVISDMKKDLKLEKEEKKKTKKKRYYKNKAK